jgi:hypothetical protein
MKLFSGRLRCLAREWLGSRNSIASIIADKSQTLVKLIHIFPFNLILRELQASVPRSPKPDIASLFEVLEPYFGISLDNRFGKRLNIRFFIAIAVCIASVRAIEYLVDLEFLSKLLGFGNLLEWPGNPRHADGSFGLSEFKFRIQTPKSS